MDSPGGVTLSTKADRLSALEVEVDRFRARRFVVWDFIRGRDLDDITDYKAGVLIEIDGKRLRLHDTMDLSNLGKQRDQSITYILRHENVEDESIWISGSLQAVLGLNDASSLYLGVDVGTFAFTGAKGRVKSGEATIEVDPLDRVFLGGTDLHMKLEKSGGVEVYGAATHAVVNGQVMWRAMGHFIPSEVWAAAIGAAVSFGLSVALLRGRSLLRDSEQ
jgi:hypothetical protein